ncbi:hypothetical protein [Flagellimonas sp.]|uniref:hypothetical protein n=1 Tax=Flagellimonas sp. TaxID=2058762 RepID=UPI003B599DC7
MEKTEPDQQQLVEEPKHKKDYLTIESFIRAFSFIKGIIHFVGIPLILILVLRLQLVQKNLKDEQLATKNETIALLEQRISDLERDRSEIIINRRNQEKEFFEEMINELKDSVLIEKNAKQLAYYHFYKSRQRDHALKGLWNFFTDDFLKALDSIRYKKLSQEPNEDL